MSYKGLSKLKKKHLKVKHQKAKVFRASEPLLSVFMWGINHTINELTHVNIPVMLMPDDFKAFTRIRVDNHLFNKENMPSHFKFKEYCPLVFRNLRERFGITDAQYLRSLTKCQPDPFGESSSGRSGARFYASYDNFLTLKTLSSEEVEQMHSFLKSYHPYVVERHGKTLLPQYLGMYRITVEATETYVVVIRNIFSAQIPIHKKYDLKGSTIDREASEKEREKQLPTLKDNDFVKDAINLKLSSESKQNFLSMLETDTQFLGGMNLIDYALSIGIHDCEKYEQELAEYATTSGNVVSDEDDGESSGGGGQSSLPPTSGHPSSSSGKVDYSYVPTPPDSPRLPRKSESESEGPAKGPIDSKRDIYAIESSSESGVNEIYFIGLIDVLTQYGLRKRTAQAAKSVKHGTTSEILSTVHPDQYGKRLCDFICKSIL